LLYDYTQRSSTDTQHRAATARTTQHKDKVMTSSEGNERGKKLYKKHLTESLRCVILYSKIKIRKGDTIQ
jgi:hypothetical protein